MPGLLKEALQSGIMQNSLLTDYILKIVKNLVSRDGQLTDRTKAQLSDYAQNSENEELKEIADSYRKPDVPDTDEEESGSYQAADEKWEQTELLNPDIPDAPYETGCPETANPYGTDQMQRKELYDEDQPEDEACHWMGLQKEESMQGVDCLDAEEGYGMELPGKAEQYENSCLNAEKGYGMELPGEAEQYENSCLDAEEGYGLDLPGEEDWYQEEDLQEASGLTMQIFYGTKTIFSESLCSRETVLDFLDKEQKAELMQSLLGEMKKVIDRQMNCESELACSLWKEIQETALRQEKLAIKENQEDEVEKKEEKWPRKKSWKMAREEQPDTKSYFMRLFGKRNDRPEKG